MGSQNSIPAGVTGKKQITAHHMFMCISHISSVKKKKRLLSSSAVREGEERRPLLAESRELKPLKFMNSIFKTGYLSAGEVDEEAVSRLSLVGFNGIYER